MPELKHPGVEGTITVSDRAAEVHKRSGWESVKDKKQQTEKSEQDKKEGGS